MNWVIPRKNGGVSGYAILDDHVPFMERGVDTLNLIDDFQDGNWWHTSKDNIGILGEKSFQQTGEMTLHRALFAASVPIIIHLVNRWRHRSVPWAAMEFLLRAARETRGTKKNCCTI